MTTTQFDLARNAHGRLTLTAADGEVHDNVVPARAFPVQAPLEGVAMLTHDGKEVAWIDRLDDLAPAVRRAGARRAGRARVHAGDFAASSASPASPRRAPGP